VTEVPEHLLKRSRDRRAALGLGGGGDGGGGASESAPSAGDSESTEVEAAGATAAARPAAVEPIEPVKPPKPAPPYVRAALARKRIPVWVMPVLAFLPIWAIIYVNTLSKPYSNVPTQIAEGQIVFSNSCASCHGSGGEGGVGRQLNNGEVLKTFPNIADQLEFVWIGDQGIGNGHGYGNPHRPGGQHIAGSYGGAQMPAWNGTLTQSDLLAVVRHERETLSGAVVPPKQIAADGSLLWPNGNPVLDPTTGLLVDPNGQPLLDPISGKLAKPAAASTPAEQA
jgi:mono/diheme cytochrome c family protein